MCYDADQDDESNSQAIANYDAAVAAVATGAAGPLTVSGDAGSVTQRSVADLIAAANYLAGVAAAQTRNKGVRFSRLIPDATVQGPRRGFRGRWLGTDWNGYSWP